MSEPELFTFVICSHAGYHTEYLYLSRHDADRHFDKLSEEAFGTPEGEFVAYYCASVGGLVNSYHVGRT